MIDLFHETQSCPDSIEVFECAKPEMLMKVERLKEPLWADLGEYIQLGFDL